MYQRVSDSTVVGAPTSLRASIQAAGATVAASFKYVWADLGRNKRTFIIAVTTVALVVGFVALLQNSIARSPIIFLKLAENSIGEADLILEPAGSDVISNFASSSSHSSSLKQASPDPPEGTPPPNNSTGTGPNGTLPDTNSTANSTNSSSSTKASLSIAYGLNCTYVQQALAPMVGTVITGATPRWLMLGKATSNYVNVNASMFILAIDSKQEELMGLGRAWTHRALGQQEAHVSASLLYQLGLTANAGDRIRLTIPIGEFLSAGGGGSALNDDSVLRQQAEIAFRNQVHSRNFSGQITQGQMAALLGLPSPPSGSDTPINVTIVGSQVPDSLIDQLFDLYFERFFQALLTIVRDGFEAEFNVVDAVESPHGKWSSSLGNVAVVESKYLMKLVSTLLPENRAMAAAILGTLGIPQEQVTDVENYPINEHAMQIIVQKHDRIASYMGSYPEAKKAIIEWTNAVSLGIGLDFQASFQAELIVTLSVTQYLRIFMDQIFTSVSVILIGLGATLIYSLLIADINEKTFEYGMLRALGLHNRSLIVILTVQALFYCIPGILVGLLGAFIVFSPLAVVLANFGDLSPDYSFDSMAIVVAVLLGFFLPIVANILPIQRVLSRTLRDALDIFFTGESTTVSFLKLGDTSINFSGVQTVASLVMVVLGFLVYYVIPWAFVNNRTGLFLGILNWILLGMVFGCIVLSTLVQPALERLVVFCSMWGQERARLSDLVKKSLSGHRVRNRKTALMFTVALSFCIFAGAMFALQTRALNANIELLVGAPIVVFAPSSKYPLDETAFREQMAVELNNPEAALGHQTRVQGYSFVTWPMGSVYFSDYAQLIEQPLVAYGVERNVLASAFPKFYQPTRWTDQFDYSLEPTYSKPDLIISLYDNVREQRLPDETYLNGSLVIPTSIVSWPIPVTDEPPAFDSYSADFYTDYLDVVVSEALQPAFQLTPDYPTTLWHAGNFFLGKIRGMVSKFPGFYFSSYSALSYGSPLLVSLDSFVRLRGNPNPNRTSLDFQRLLLRTRSDLTEKERAAVINGLRSCYKDSFTQVIDTVELLEGTEQASSLILVFFNVITLVAILMCFFSLWLSFIANVNENAWEFGVLRAIGLSSLQVVRIYLYEAFALILSAVIISTIIGFAIAATLTLQFDIFSEMAFEFTFPSFLFFSVCTLSIAVAFLGSWMAAQELRKKPIAAALKGL